MYREFSWCSSQGTARFPTANLWDYGTIIARLIPNRFQCPDRQSGWSGRAEKDTPTVYKTNTRATLIGLPRRAGRWVSRPSIPQSIPQHLMFNGALFYLGVGYERPDQPLQSASVSVRVDTRDLAEGWLGGFARAKRVRVTWRPGADAVDAHLSSGPCPARFASQGKPDAAIYPTPWNSSRHGLRVMSLGGYWTPWKTDDFPPGRW